MKIGALALVLLLLVGCRSVSPRRGPATPTPDPRLTLSEPVVRPRAGAAGAPVDCSVEVANRSGRSVSRVIVTCELLDPDGVPIGVGLGSLLNLGNGESQQVRTVVYGVRAFASARAAITSATFQ